MTKERNPVNEAAVPETQAATVQPYYSGIDWGALLFRLLEKIHWIILAALLGGAIAWLYVTQMVTPIYQATSKIYIAGSDTTISLSDLQLGSTLATDYQEVFKIWHVHEMVDERLNLNYSYSQLSDMVSVSNPSGSHLLYIYVKSPNPDEAKQLADTYAEVVQDYIANKMELRKPQILEKARTPGVPVYPNVRSTVINGFLIGGAIATLVFLFVFLLDDRIRTAEEITKAVDLPVFGTVPLQDMEHNREEEDTPIRGDIPADRGRFAEIRGNLAMDYHGAESINTVCASMTFVGANVRKVIITSCSPDEGKTFTALQIAIGMTRRGKRVLLMDCDLRKSVMRNRYDIRLPGEGKGLAHVLSGQCLPEEAVYETNIPNLYLIPDGANVKTPLSLFTSPEFDMLLNALSGSVDLIIADTPPLGAVVDAAEIARRFDGAMVVLEYNRTRAKALKEAVALLKQTDTRILGCIINKAPGGKRGYGGYYRYGGKYGYDYRNSASETDGKKERGRWIGKSRKKNE